MINPIPPTAEIIKTAVLSYYRFKRQYLCADEVHVFETDEICDVLADSNKAFFEVEIKLTKTDLWQGEAKKKKHEVYKKLDLSKYKLPPPSIDMANITEIVVDLYAPKNLPNYFLLCVPPALKEEAEKWIAQTNTKYGLLIFNDYPFKYLAESIWTVKSPKKLHEDYSPSLKKALAKRLCSAYITHRQIQLRKTYEAK